MFNFFILIFLILCNLTRLIDVSTVCNPICKFLRYACLVLQAESMLGMTVMAVSINEICENTKLAREMALMGNYETSGVYYQGVVQQMHRLLQSIADPTRKGKWQLVSNVLLTFHVNCMICTEF